MKSCNKGFFPFRFKLLSAVLLFFLLNGVDSQVHSPNNIQKVPHASGIQQGGSIIDGGNAKNSKVKVDSKKSNQKNRSNRVNNKPLLHNYLWVHDACSWGHAIMCIICYVVLTLKVYYDKSALGISIQTLFALCFSELCGAILNVWFSFYTGIPLDWSFQVDLLSTFLSIMCLFTVYSRFSNSIEDQYDTFGLNIMVRFAGMFNLANVDYQSIKNGKRAGSIKPTGKIGTLMQTSYWLVLYLMAIPISLVFLFFRKNSRLGFITILLTYDDAIRAIALIPQLYMFHIKSNRKVSEHLAVFVLCEFVLKALALIYWLSMPLFRTMHESRGYNVAVQLFNLAILFDFVFCYFKAKFSGQNGLQYAADFMIPITL